MFNTAAAQRVQESHLWAFGVLVERGTPVLPVARRYAFSLVELLAVIAVFTVLIALLMVGVQKARSAADNARCVSNLRASGNAILQYFQDNNGAFFPEKNWFVYPSSKARPNSGMLDYFWPAPLASSANAATDPVFKRDTILTCPAMKRKYPDLYPQALNRGYAINYYLNAVISGTPVVGSPQRLINVSKPSAMLMLTESPINGGLLGSLNDGAASHGDKYLPLPHGGRQNAIFMDGHIESLSVDDFAHPPNPRAFWGNLNLPETQPAP